MLGTSLLTEGKSTRLLQMRQKAMGLAAERVVQCETTLDMKQDETKDTELARARQIIDHRLQAILSRFPADKKQNFFRIRYGATPEKLKELPISEIFNLLQLQQNPSVNMKHIADLDYNGRPISNRA